MANAVNKLFRLYFNDLSLPFNPALMVVSEEKQGPYILYLREGIKDGKVLLKIWGRDKEEDVQSDIEAATSNLGLSDSFSTTNARGFSDLAKENLLAMECIKDMINAGRMSNFLSPSTSFVNFDVFADFWKTQLPGESRPYRNHKGVEGFTFNALKTMWKVLGKSGHSNKSKADLFEGFAETAVDYSSSEEAENFLGTLPKRMVVVSVFQHYSSAPTSIADPKKILPMISRVSAGCLYAADHSPDIDEKNVTGFFQFIDLKDPYDGAIGGVNDNEMSSLSELNTLYYTKTKK